MHSEPTKNSKQLMITSSFSIKLTLMMETGVDVVFSKWVADSNSHKEATSPTNKWDFTKTSQVKFFKWLFISTNFSRKKFLYKIQISKLSSNIQIKARVWTRKSFFPKFKYRNFPQTKKKSIQEFLKGRNMYELIN